MACPVATMPVLGFPDVRDEPVYIYGLADPQTGEIRYVGKSAKPELRPNNHRTKGARGMIAWFEELAADGRKPMVIRLEMVTPGEDVNPREEFHIRTQLELGARLLNVRVPSGCKPWGGVSNVRRLSGKRPLPAPPAGLTYEGPQLLRAFLVEHDLTATAAAYQLRTSPTSIHYWLTGADRPQAARRLRIARWTNQRVPEPAWQTPEEHEELDIMKRLVANRARIHAPPADPPPPDADAAEVAS